MFSEIFHYDISRYVFIFIVFHSQDNNSLFSVIFQLNSVNLVFFTPCLTFGHLGWGLENPTHTPPPKKGTFVMTDLACLGRVGGWAWEVGVNRRKSELKWTHVFMLLPAYCPTNSTSQWECEITTPLLLLTWSSCIKPNQCEALSLRPKQVQPLRMVGSNI